MKPKHYRPKVSDSDVDCRIRKSLAVVGKFRKEDGNLYLTVRTIGDDAATEFIEVPFVLLASQSARQLRELLIGRGLLRLLDQCNEKEISAWMRREAMNCNTIMIDRPGLHEFDGERILVSHGRAYPIGSNVEAEERFKLVGPAAVVPEAKGTLKELNKQIAPVFAANWLMLVALCMVLAAPLLKLFGRKPLGLLIVGRTSTGKSLLQNLLLSIVNGSGKVVPLHATPVGLHDLLAAQGAVAFFLEDVHKSDDVGAVLDATMDAGNGSARIRSSIGSHASPSNPVDCTLIMSGEADLADTARRGGKAFNGGHAARHFAMYVGNHGIFDDLCGRDSAGVMVAELRAATDIYQGVLGVAFISAIAKDWGKVERMWAKNCAAIKKSIAVVAGRRELGGMNERLLEAMAFACFVGFIAIKFGVLEISPTSLKDAFRKAFKEHLDRTPLSTPVGTQVVEAVRHYLQCNNARFLRLESAANASNRRDLVGFVKTDRTGCVWYLFFPGVFRNEFGKFGLDAYAYLREAGYLRSQRQRHNLTSVRVRRGESGAGTPEDFVCIDGRILSSEEPR